MFLSLAHVVLAVSLAVEADGDEAAQAFRARVLAEFDADGDGRLNATEREQLRKAGKPFAAQRPVFRRDRHHPDTVKKFDRDGDGKLNREESRAARRALESRWGQLVGQYKAFERDRPNVANLRKLEADAKSGKIKDFPLELYGWIRGSIEFAGRSGRGQRRHLLSQFDADGDGRLNADELKAARAELARRRQAQKKETAAPDEGDSSR